MGWLDRAIATGRAGLVALARTNPSPARFPSALSAGLAMLLAIGLPALLGRPDVGLLASLGALAALYLGDRSRGERSRQLPLVVLALLLAAAAGAGAATQPLLAAVVLAVVAVASTALVLRFRVGPPGALFAVLVAGVAERLAAPGRLGGDDVPTEVVVSGVALGGVVAYLVISVPLLLPPLRVRDRARVRTPHNFQLSRGDLAVLLRVVIGVAVAVGVGAAAELSRSYWVVVAVVAVLQAAPGRRQSLIRAVHRLLGTAGGCAVFALLALLDLRGLLLAFLIAALQFTVELIIVRHYGLALLLITPLALLVAGGARGDVGSTVRDRIVDTAVGCVVAGAVLLADFMVAVLRRRRSVSDGI